MRMSQRLFQCENCGNLFSRPTFQVNRDLRRGTGHLYCSPECRAEGSRRRIWIRCAECSIEKEIPLSDAEASTSGNHFCSRLCANRYHARMRADRHNEVRAGAYFSRAHRVLERV